jgi:uncharacterized protein YqeY
MSMIDTVRSAMMAAMKEKNKPRKEALSMLLAALKNKAIDKRADLTGEEEAEVVLREIKQAKETLESVSPDHTELIEEAKLRIQVYSEFAPRQMSEEQIREAIAQVLSQLGLEQPSAKDKGKIMKALMPLVKGKADGGLVNRLVGQVLEG